MTSSDAQRYAAETAWWYMQIAGTEELREYWRKRWEAAKKAESQPS